MTQTKNVEVSIKSFPRLVIQKIFRFFHELIEWFFGILTMVSILAVIAIIPIINVVSLGYLIQMGANISKSGRLKDGLIGVKNSAYFGRVAVASYLCLLPVQFLLELQIAAKLTEPSGDRDKLFGVAAMLLLFLTVLHILWSCIRGGKIRHFLWPAPIAFLRWLKKKHSFPFKFQILKTYFLHLNIAQYFWLGLRSFLGAFIWLSPPIALMILASSLPPSGVLLAVPAGIVLMWVVLHLPFLQLRLATENRFKAIFEIKAIREGFRKTPFSSWLALFATLLFATPLYLLKIELTPREIAWLPSFIFVLFIFPARLLVGWALYRSRQKTEPSHKAFLWLGRLTIVPILLAYVILVYVSQYLSWNGAYSLLEQHAFLVPAPLLGL